MRRETRDKILNVIPSLAYPVVFIWIHYFPLDSIPGIAIAILATGATSATIASLPPIRNARLRLLRKRHPRNDETEQG